MTYRNVDTSMWKDEWFLELTPEEKLLFVYLFSNENTLLTGLYKISLRVIEFETGLSKQFIVDTIGNKFSPANKVHYEDGVIWVVNLRKYNDSKSPKVIARIAWELKQIPECPIKNAYLRRNDTVSITNNSVPDDNNTLSIDYQYTTDTDPTLTLTNQSNPNQIKPEQGGAPDYFSLLQHVIERLTGLPITPTKRETDALNEMIRLEITEDDLSAAVNWFRDNGKTARGPASLLESAKVSHAKRIQASNPNGAKPAKDQAVWAEDYKFS